MLAREGCAGARQFVLVHPIGRLFRLFPQSEPSLRILAFGIVFLFASSAFYAMLNAINRQHLNAWATGLAAAINILSLIHISEPTRLGMISYAVFCLKK